MTFEELGLSENFAQRLAQMGVKEPTPIQAEVFKPIVSGQSVLGLSKTGTGKTFAFLCPLVQKFSSTEIKSNVRGIVLVPTRELAVQVGRDLSQLTGTEQKSAVIVGGEPEEMQIQLCRSATWVIATPGRLFDLLKRSMIDVSQAEAIVFDEADRLLDMGFIDEIRGIMKLLPRSMQMCFFSATLHFGVDEMAYEFGAECFRFGQEEPMVTVEGLDHRVAFVGDNEKFHALVWYIASQGKARGIVFSNYREKVHEIAGRLNGLGCDAASLTAQLTQGARTRIMQEFREGKVQVLLASDLAARGLDVFDIDYVVNYDLPEDPASYVHRVGRTARAGRAGQALSFVGFEDSFRLERLEKYLGKPVDRFQIPVEALEGRLHRFKPTANPNAQEYTPRQEREGGRGGRGASARGRSHGADARQGAPREHRPSMTPRPAASVTHAPKRAPEKLSWMQKVSRFFKGLLGTKPAAHAATSAREGSGSVSRPASASTPGRSGGGRRGSRGPRRPGGVSSAASTSPRRGSRPPRGRGRPSG
ncbi:MAG: DEAD/DEAH box helicase [Bdellovibrionales bacterium]|nr:DEAD/DEAH box helicase [Bdellovibrionales bacterium]